MVTFFFITLTDPAGCHLYNSSVLNRMLGNLMQIHGNDPIGTNFKLW